MAEFKKEFLDGVVAKDCREAAEFLCNAFVWEASPQGYNAWAAMYDALYEIAAAKEAK